MYCPKCGQQQMADNTRFCSRCGLPIDGLAQWLAGDATAVARDQGLAVAISPRRKGIRRGAKLLFLSAVVAPIFLGLSVFNDSPFPLIVPFTLFLAAISLILYSSIFQEKSVSQTAPARPKGLGAAFSNNALSPASQTWTPSRASTSRTAELAQPPSVTENTTRLLNDDDN